MSALGLGRLSIDAATAGLCAATFCAHNRHIMHQSELAHLQRIATGILALFVRNHLAEHLRTMVFTIEYVQPSNFVLRLAIANRLMPKLWYIFEVWCGLGRVREPTQAHRQIWRHK